MKNQYIIFADDDPDDRDLLSGFFREFNSDTRILEFNDGKEMIGFLENFSQSVQLPALIVLDVNMPRMDGKETLRALRSMSRYRYIPVIIHTTSFNSQDEEFYKSLQASWMMKSTNVQGLRDTAKVIADFCRMQTF